MPNKAPSAGKKVTTGENIPTHREAPGKVPEGSLAAESARKGGEFASNPGQEEQGPQKYQQQQQQSSSHTGGTAANKTTSLHLENQQTSRGTGTGTTGKKTAKETGTGTGGGGGGLDSQASYGGAAPTYVSNQRHRNPAGPHGKNLKEGGFEGSGTEAGPLPEPGSMEDPARVATRGMKAGVGGTGGGPNKQQAGGTGGKTWYTPLGGDEPA
ncbi:hypothetical protein C8A00DRAFT_14695 [Chaetomidium leptoderma]|uniref:Uncharacterized protein n=1 Tax=Chaetomidium leptoderma TaxID=669021 RepID=A0AAN6ZZ18_9PEZI|nr:hypothetical protein C8A00DRAFT_14695 [Chaetomidium leptoderma]